MKNVLITVLLTFTCMAGNAQLNHGYPIDPVPFTSVTVTDTFWGQRLKASREVTIPLAFSKCEETGRYENFIKAAHPGETYKVEGFPFDDTDVYKTIEGASYSLQTYPDKKLQKYIDSVLIIVAAAQEPDGYLYTARTMNPAHPHNWAGKERWSVVENLSHEFYNLGHMIEGAIAHYQATGKRNFLDIAIKYADCVCREIGNEPKQKRLVPGHQIAEMALAKLYLVTGDKKYLDQAKFFLDARGHTSRKDAYSQAHKPVVEQDEAVGHAVRAAYMYSGMADVAAITGDSSYIKAIDRIWDNIISKKIYITGGIGARHAGEAFGNNYELPNLSAYCETCAAIGNVYMNYRLFLLHGDAKYFDVLERTLYNGLISGVSLDGGSFFYPNPLASNGGYSRKPWFGCACCPSNISRFIPSLPGYVYAIKDNQVYVNLYLSNKAELKVNQKKIVLEQETGYPWNGDIRVKVTKGSQKFTLKLRIPGWVRNEVLPSDLYTYADTQKPAYRVTVNGQEVLGELNNGYLSIERKWKKGDVIEIRLDMLPRIVKANEKVTDDRGRVAVERGPIVYCAEWPDNQCNIHTVLLNQRPQFKVIEKPDLLYGINQITTDAQSLSYDKNGKLATKDVKLTLIPYYAWAHRGEGDMEVWLPIDIGAASALPQKTGKWEDNGFFKN
ncbi:glycoside hydrolase family 127 protein [uncultured Bacteroides sp.]|uniref:glycoside hydrolase family 127 protein n=1 Tax=uncultured Bacteroides sp. TaxID=162156 RepID=UPI002674B711|nr:glycoside hydrolase family 127 protein [uncultured Bacteroides sp.]